MLLSEVIHWLYGNKNKFWNVFLLFLNSFSEDIKFFVTHCKVKQKLKSWGRKKN